jgi:hypothetical protein
MIIDEYCMTIDGQVSSFRSSRFQQENNEIWARSEALALSWNDGFKKKQYSKPPRFH